MSRTGESAFHFRVWLGGVFLLVSFPPASAAHGVEGFGGIHTNFGGKHRREFGNAAVVGLAYSAPLTPRDVHLIVEVAYVTNAGRVPGDPTFELPETTYWLVPIVLGIRTNLIGAEHQGRLGLYYGLGFVSVLSGLEEAWEETSRAPTFGAMMELRPELRVSPSWSFWLRNRIVAVADAGYAFRELNHSGLSLQLGASLGAP